jgi:ATP-dependent RNA helicase DeaD
MTVFKNVHSSLDQALNGRGYDILTPVQEAVLAAEIKEADLLVSAQTGSGKTVAFGLALAPTLLGDADRFTGTKTPLALAIAPTRELALQVKRELQWLYEHTGANFASCVGGMDMREERRALNQGAHIVVGTPGRLRDHVERHSLDMSGLKAVVLDEADEMLDLGFRDDLEFILGASPAGRRTLMFSATVPKSITSLAKRYQRNAVRVSTASDREQHVDIEYRALTVAPRDRENAIINILRFVDAKNALVFCSTRAAVNRMTSRFANRGFSVVALSGELSQNERTHALQSLRDARARVCIATDVAARGLDLPDLELVIHAEIPKNRESLLHRSGRTGRAGRKGLCVLIVPNNERRRTERLLDSANVTAAWVRPPSADDINQRDRERILKDPSLDEPLTDEEFAFAKELLAGHSAEQVAAAFLRLHAVGKSAPEELLDVSDAPIPAEKKRREHFTGGVWFSLSIGRNQQAEARWLLPMLCRVGQLTKHDIGSIKVQANETRFELIADSVKRFLDAVGPTMIVEDSITITSVSGPPKADTATPVSLQMRGHPRSQERTNTREQRPNRKLQETSNKSYKKKKSFVADKPTEVTVVADKPTEVTVVADKPTEVAVNFELHDSKSQETRPKKNPTKENSFVAKRPPNVAVGLEIQDSRVRVDVPDKLYTKKKPNPGKGSAKRAKHKPKVFKSYRQPDTKYVQRNGGAETRETLKQDNTGIQKDATLSASSRKLHLRLDDNTKSGKRPGFKFARPNLTKDGVPEKSGNSPLKRKKLKNPKKRIR